MYNIACRLKLLTYITNFTLIGVGFLQLELEEICITVIFNIGSNIAHGAYKFTKDILRHNSSYTQEGQSILQKNKIKLKNKI